MNIELKDIYKLDIKNEWCKFMNKNENKISNTVDKIIDAKVLFCSSGFYPIYTDGYILWLYRNNSENSSNTVDLIKWGLTEPITINSMNFNITSYYELIKLVSNQKFNKKDFKGEIPKPIKEVINKGFKIIENYSGSQSSDWFLIRNAITSTEVMINNEKIIYYWRMKLNKYNKPILSNLMSIPHVVITNLISILSRTTEKEDEYVKHFGLLTKKELLLLECGVPQDLLKSIKTVHFENLGFLEKYFEWLKVNNLTDNIENADKYHTILVEQLDKERSDYLKSKKGVN